MKGTVLILIGVLISSCYFAAAGNIGNQNYPTSYIDGGPTGSYDYMVFTFENNTGTYYAAKDKFGKVVDSWTSTNTTFTLKSASDAIQANGQGTLQIKNGLYPIEPEWTIDGGTPITVRGEGRNTILKRVDNMPFYNGTLNGEQEWANVIRVKGSEGVVIENLAIDGNYLNQIACNDGDHPDNYWGIRDNHHEDVYNGIFLDSTSNSTIQNCWIYDSGTNNIRIGVTQHSSVQIAPANNIVRNNYIWGGRNGVLQFNSASGPYQGNGTIVEGNQIFNGRGYGGVYIVQAYFVNTVNNHIYGFTNPGMGEAGGIRYATGASFGLIANNNIHDTQWHSIYLAGAHNNTVIGNVLYKGFNGLYVAGNNTNIWSNDISNMVHNGIFVSGSYTSIKGNDLSGSIRNGIHLQSTSTYTNIEGNDIYGNGRTGIYNENGKYIQIKLNKFYDNEWDTEYSERAEIYLGPNGDYVTIQDNESFDTREGDARTAGRTVRGFGPNYNLTVIQNNVIYNTKSPTIIYFSSWDTVKINNNVGFVTENSGNNTGTGAQQTIAHGCNFTPTYSQVYLSERSTGGALAYQSQAPDATNIYVTATNEKDYNWKIEMCP